MIKKIETKTMIKILAGIFTLFLCIHYWTNISGVIGTVLNAAAPLLIGCAAAYTLNILMSFYERHFFRIPEKNLYVNHAELSAFYWRLLLCSVFLL